MFEDKNNGHTCYCENCLKLQAENEELRKSIEILKDTVKIQTHTIDIKDRQLQQLKKENEELKNELKIQKYKRIVVECGKRSFKNILHKYALFQQCLDEIEKICDFNYTKENTRILANEILQLIKQAKEGE